MLQTELQILNLDTGKCEGKNKLHKKKLKKNHSKQNKIINKIVKSKLPVML